MSVLSIPITKGKANIEIETGDLPDDVYQEALLQGLKVLLNRGASKITKETYPDAAELVAAAMAKANEQVELVKTSKIKFTGASKSTKKESGAVMTEARRLAKNVVKDAIKANGGKISHYEARDITAAANELLKADASLIEQAKANLEALEAKPTAVDIKSLISVSAKKVAQADAKKAKAKADAPLSAKQAGKVKPRVKPAAGATPQA